MPLIPGVPHILHGGDYNPDQWPDFPQMINEDFHLMDKAFCNTLSVGIFAWGTLEPADGIFDFAWLDAIFAHAEKSRKKFFLSMPSAAAPEWLVRQHPEICMVNEQGASGNRVSPGRTAVYLHPNSTDGSALLTKNFPNVMADARREANRHRTAFV